MKSISTSFVETCCIRQIVYFNYCVEMYWPQTEEQAVPRPASVSSTHSGSNVSTKASSSRGKNDICVGEELKIAVNIALERFRLSEEQKGDYMT